MVAGLVQQLKFRTGEQHAVSGLFDDANPAKVQLKGKDPVFERIRSSFHGNHQLLNGCSRNTHQKKRLLRR